MLTCRDPSGEEGCGLDYLHVTLKRDVAANHVEEQDAERPDGERDGLIGLRQDPLRRTVDPSPCGGGGGGGGGGGEQLH